MHEFSIAGGVVDIALGHCDGRRVSVVTMRVGALRQVVPATLETAFELVARGTACEGANLQLEVVPPRLSCSECAFEWTPLEPDFRCKSCDGPAVVIAGRELQVESIEVEDPPP